MEFIYDPGMVLYLPLYELDGPSFISRDAYGHLCAATGSLWRPEGRYFNGNDKINCGSSSVLNFTGEAFTIIAWVNPTLAAVMDVLCRNEAQNKNGYFFRIVSDGRIGLRTSQESASQDSYSVAGSMVANTWAQVSAVRSGAAVTFYKNGETLAYNTQGTHVDPGSYAGDFLIGEQVDGSRDFDGCIGEVMVFNRALTPQEIHHYYRITKRRYR